MALLSRKLRSTSPGPAHWCPACGTLHIFYTERPTPSGARWTWDGNADAPTFRPSMVVSYGSIPGDKDAPAERCHYFLRAGQLEYLADSTHALAGQTVPLPDLPLSSL